MGETKNGMSNRKVEQEEWDELWAVARDMGRIEDRRIGLEKEAGGEVHHTSMSKWSSEMHESLGGV